MSAHKLERWDRRALLRLGMAAVPAVVLTLTRRSGILWAAQCDATPEQTEGPFYMRGIAGIPQPAALNDLTRAAGAKGVADGEVIWVEGRVSDRDCRPVAGAQVEIWQACATGRYAHPRDGNPALLDPNFGYFGAAITDADGGYRFKTIKPGAYPVGGGWVRPSHIHFRAEGPRLRELTTQMYFAGDPHQERDGVLRAVPPGQRRRVIIEPGRDTAEPRGAENRYRFDLTLESRG